MMKDNHNMDDQIDRHIQIAVEQRADREFVELLSQVDDATLGRAIELANEAPKSSTTWRKVIRFWVAGVAVGAAAAVVLIFVGSQPFYDSAELSARYFSVPVYEAAPPSRGGEVALSDRDEMLCDRAAALYQDGRFVEAVAMYDLVEGDLGDEQLFYCGISLNETGNLDRAAKYLERVSAMDHSEFQYDAQWTLVMIDLQNEARTGAVDRLRKIANSDSPYADQVDELINKIEQKRWF